MSHSLDLYKPEHTLVVDGETYHFGEEHLGSVYHGVTFNYYKILSRVLGDSGITSIYGLTGKQSIPILEQAISQLGNDVNPDYFVATEGNVKKQLQELLEYAKIYPYGIWRGD